MHHSESGNWRTNRPHTGRTVMLFPGLGDLSALEAVRQVDPDTVDDVSRVVDRIAAVELPEPLAVDQPAHLATFTAAVAGVRILAARGVRPDVVIGVSFGEIAAMVTAGVFGLAQGAAIACRLIKSIVPEGVGAMAAVSLDPKSVSGMIADYELDDTVIACVSAPQRVLLAGPVTEITRFVKTARASALPAVVLQSQYRVHHPGNKNCADRCVEAIASMRPRAPRVPVVSAVVGRPYQPYDDLHLGLAANFVKPADVPRAIRATAEMDLEKPKVFIECAPASGYDRVVPRLLEGVAALSPFAKGGWAAIL